MDNSLISMLVELYQDGGYIIVGIFLLSVYLYETAFRSLIATSRIAQPYGGMEDLVKESNWILKTSNPWRGFLEEMHSSDLDKDDIIYQFQRSRRNLLCVTHSDLLRLKISIAAAPLLGLLGTIIGMVDTFVAISSAAGSNTSLMVAQGISKALITTSAGLMVALPALFITYLIKRKLRQALVVLEMLQFALLKQDKVAAT